jgi:hypothetical protein
MRLGNFLSPVLLSLFADSGDYFSKRHGAGISGTVR